MMRTDQIVEDILYLNFYQLLNWSRLMFPVQLTLPDPDVGIIWRILSATVAVKVIPIVLLSGIHLDSVINSMFWFCRRQYTPTPFVCKIAYFRSFNITISITETINFFLVAVLIQRFSRYDYGVKSYHCRKDHLTVSILSLQADIDIGRVYSY